MDAANLAMVRTSFGTGVDNFVRVYSPADVQTAYFAEALVVNNTVQPESAWDYEEMGLGAFLGQPSWDMTMNDVWWEEFARPGATVASASSAAAIRLGALYYGAWKFGYLIGGYVYIWLDYLDPNINIEIGNTLDSAEDEVVNIVNGVSGTGYVDLPDFYSLVDSVDYSMLNDWWWWIY